MEISIGSIIRKARKERGMSQKEVGALASISHVLICHIECDRFFYSEESLKKLASTLDLDINHLLDLRKNQYTTPQVQIQEMIAEKIDKWYIKWKDRIVDNGKQHRLGIAKEELKNMLCTPYEESTNKIFDMIHEDILNNRP